MQKNFLKFGMAILVGLLIINFFAYGDSRDNRGALADKTARARAEKKAAYTEEVRKIMEQSINAAPLIQVGDKAMVPRWEWCPVKNPDGIRNGNVFHKFNETCGIEEGGIIEVVGFVGNDLLVKYSAPDFRLTYGTPCPCGTALIIERSKFVEMTEEYQKIAQARDAEKNSIAAILEKK